MASVTDKASQSEGDADSGTDSSECRADWSPPLDWPNQGTKTGTKPEHPPFLRIPVEIMVPIVNSLGYSAELASLAKTCRTCYNLSNPILYKNNIKVGYSSSLFWGAIHGVLNSVKLAYAAGADLNFKGHEPWILGFRRVILNRGYDGATAMHWAARHNHPDVVNWLLDQGVDIDIPSTGVCFRKYEDMPSPRQQNPPLSWRPLHDCLSKRSLRCARLLINRGASVSLEATHGAHTALHSAAANGLVSIIDLLDQKSLLGDIHSRDSEGNTALHHLASLRQKTNSAVIPRTLAKLLSLGADLEMVNNFGHAPLVHACRRRNIVLARHLLASGANPDPHRATRSPGDRPMSLTILGHSDPFGRLKSRRSRRRFNNETWAFLGALVAAGVEVDARLQDNNATDLMYACQLADTPVVHLLVRFGASVNVEDFQGRTPLKYLVEHWDPDTSALLTTSAMLLRHGARIDTRRSIDTKFKWLLDALPKHAYSILRNAGMANISRQGLSILVEQSLLLEKPDPDEDYNLATSVLRLAKNTYGLRNEDILRYLDLFMDWDDYRGLESLVELGFIHLVTDQGEAYQPHCIKDSGTVYFSTEALLVRALGHRKENIIRGIIDGLKVYAAGPRFAGGQTLLHLLCRFIIDHDGSPFGRFWIFSKILDTLGSDDIDIFDNELRTPLSIAVQANNLEVAHALLEAGAYPHLEPGDDVLEAIYPDDEDDRRFVRKHFLTAFNLAIRESRLKIVQAMLTIGNNALPDIPPMSTTSYVHQACKLATTAILEELEKQGADMNGGERWLNPPAAVILGEFWSKQKLRQQIGDSIEVGFSHLELLLDFPERVKNHKDLTVPPKVYHLLTEIAGYTGADGYKRGMKEMARRKLGVFVARQTLTFQLEDSRAGTVRSL